jgi:hypothetical protein
MTQLDVEARLDLQDLVSLYVHLVDHSAWDRLGEVLHQDAVIDFRNFAPYIPVLEGLPAIEKFFREMEHPIAHHGLNPLVTAGPDEGSHRVTSKILIVMRNKDVYVGEYRDVAVRTADGWRFTERVASRAHRLGKALPSPFDSFETS